MLRAMTALLPSRLAILAAGLLAAAAVAAAPAPASAAPAACPATFAVQHDDRIGALAVPAGSYQITVADPTRLTCGHASDWFRQFLEDFDGRLPSPWKLDAGTATFSAGNGIAFQIARASTPSGGGGGQHPATGLLCPGAFQVLHNDHIGSFAVPKGSYSVTLLSVGPLTCNAAMKRFAAFLQDYDGRLPAPWLLDPQTGTFLRGGALAGFRIAPAVTPPPGPTPSTGGLRCAGTFRVLHNDRIGALRLPKGRYWITRTSTGRPTCAASTRLLASFLQRPDGKLPKPWRLQASTGTFLRPSGAGFSVKPAL
jgi:hypothetical protein